MCTYIICELNDLSGFLLREIKDFWRVALLMSTLLYEIDSNEDLLNKNFQLEKLKNIFKAAENTVIELGKATFNASLLNFPLTSPRPLQPLDSSSISFSM